MSDQTCWLAKACNLLLPLQTDLAVCVTTVLHVCIVCTCYLCASDDLSLMTYLCA